MVIWTFVLQGLLTEYKFWATNVGKNSYLPETLGQLLDCLGIKVNDSSPPTPTDTPTEAELDHPIDDPLPFVVQATLELLHSGHIFMKHDQTTTTTMEEEQQQQQKVDHDLQQDAQPSDNLQPGEDFTMKESDSEIEKPNFAEPIQNPTSQERIEAPIDQPNNGPPEIDMMSDSQSQTLQPSDDRTSENPLNSEVNLSSSISHPTSAQQQVDSSRSRSSSRHKSSSDSMDREKSQRKDRDRDRDYRDRDYRDRERDRGDYSRDHRGDHRGDRSRLSRSPPGRSSRSSSMNYRDSGSYRHSSSSNDHSSSSRRDSHRGHSHHIPGGGSDSIGRDRHKSPPSPSQRGSYGSSIERAGMYVIRIRGLPWQAAESDIQAFFSPIQISSGGIHLLLDGLGRPTGEGYVQFQTQHEHEQAIRRHKHYMGKRYVEVFPSSFSELSKYLSRHHPRGSGGSSKSLGGPSSSSYSSYRGSHQGLMDSHHGGGGGSGSGGNDPRGLPLPPYGSGSGGGGNGSPLSPHHHHHHHLPMDPPGKLPIGPRFVLRMRGLPYSARVHDVLSFFHGLDLTKNDVFLISDGPSGATLGEGFVRFRSEPEAAAAMNRHNDRIGSRLIELFHSGLSELGDALRYHLEMGHSVTGGLWDFSDILGDLLRVSVDLGGGARGLPMGPSSSSRQPGGGRINDHHHHHHHRGDYGPSLYDSDRDHRRSHQSNSSSYSHSHHHHHSGGGSTSGRGDPLLPTPSSIHHGSTSSYGGSESSGSGGDGSSWVIRMRGLPFSALASDIQLFFGELHILPNGVHMVFNHQGRPSGEAYVEFATEEDFNRAFSKHNQMMGSRYIELFRSSRDDLIRYKQKELQSSGSGYGTSEPLIGTPSTSIGGSGTSGSGVNISLSNGPTPPIPSLAGPSMNLLPSGTSPILAGGVGGIPSTSGGGGSSSQYNGHSFASGAPDPNTLLRLCQNGTITQTQMQALLEAAKTNHPGYKPSVESKLPPSTGEGYPPRGGDYRTNPYTGYDDQRSHGVSDPVVDSPNSLLIRGLTADVTVADIENYFESYQIIPGSIRVISNMERTIFEAWISFCTVSEAQRALQGRPSGFIGSSFVRLYDRYY